MQNRAESDDEKWAIISYSLLRRAKNIYNLFKNRTSNHTRDLIFQLSGLIEIIPKVFNDNKIAKYLDILLTILSTALSVATAPINFLISIVVKSTVQNVLMLIKDSIRKMNKKNKNFKNLSIITVDIFSMFATDRITYEISEIKFIINLNSKIINFRSFIWNKFLSFTSNFFSIAKKTVAKIKSSLTKILLNEPTNNLVKSLIETINNNYFLSRKYPFAMAVLLFCYIWDGVYRVYKAKYGQPEKPWSVKSYNTLNNSHSIDDYIKTSRIRIIKGLSFESTIGLKNPDDLYYCQLHTQQQTQESTSNPINNLSTSISKVTTNPQPNTALSHVNYLNKNLVGPPQKKNGIFSRRDFLICGSVIAIVAPTCFTIGFFSGQKKIEMVIKKLNNMVSILEKKNNKIKKLTLDLNKSKLSLEQLEYKNSKLTYENKLNKEKYEYMRKEYGEKIGEIEASIGNKKLDIRGIKTEIEYKIKNILVDAEYERIMNALVDEEDDYKFCDKIKKLVINKFPQFNISVEPKEKIVFR